MEPDNYSFSMNQNNNKQRCSGPTTSGVLPLRRMLVVLLKAALSEAPPLSLRAVPARA